MPDIEVRPVEERDLDGFNTVRSLTYNNGDPIPLERQVLSPGTRSFVAGQNGDIVGACQVLDMTATRGKAILACGAVAGVAVLPELRRSGVGSAMMTWLISHLGETGTPLASLYAFREPFYRKFGYEVVGRRIKIVCPTNRWPKLECRLPIHRLSPADWRELVDCYAEFASSRSGLNMRSEWQWKRVLGENRELTIYAVGEPVEAYAVVSHVTAFWTTDHISEIVWSTRRGYEGLLSMMGGLAINKTALSWFEPSDGPFYTDYLDQGVSASLDRPIMFRVNNVPSALQGLKPDRDISGHFVIAVEDILVAGNRGPWQIDYANGFVDVTRLDSGATWDIRLNIRHLAQAFLGEPSLEQLVGIGNVEVCSAAGYAAAVRLLPPASAYCMDFF